MKVVRKNQQKTRSVTLRLSEELMQKIDKISEKEGISRQKLIEAVLDQSINDKKFVLTL